jgi:hypothetical protein
LAIPNDIEIRRYYQSALQRLDDAEFLLTGKRTTSAVYLAGYSVECMLKALILSAVPTSKRLAAVNQFRKDGSKAHDLIWLKNEFLKRRGAPFPATIQSALTFMSTWSVHLRYSPKILTPRFADRFLQSARLFVTFADMRL